MDGTYDVQFADGDYEPRVPKARIKVYLEEGNNVLVKRYSRASPAPEGHVATSLYPKG